MEFTELDYQIMEGTRNNTLPVTVSFDTAMKHVVELIFKPLTYDQFFAEGLTLPSYFPERDFEASSMLVLGLLYFPSEGNMSNEGVGQVLAYIRVQH